MRGRTGLRLGGLLALVIFVQGCASPVGVRRVDEQTVHKILSANVISNEEPSALSRQVLLRLNLFDRFETEPEAVLRELHDAAVKEMDLDRLFALAEYSFHHAMRTDDRFYFVAASIYAYAYLFPSDDTPRPNAFDSRFRAAVDVYNRGIAQALVNDEGEVALRGGTVAFPLGQLEVTIDPRGLEWADRQLTGFVDAAELDVRGLRNRYRRVGIGAPFVAEAVRGDRTIAVRNANIPDRVTVPVTFFVRFPEVREQLVQGQYHAIVEVYSIDAAVKIEVEGRTVPLEYETTSALAYSLEGADVWDFEIAGYLSGDVVPVETQLMMLHPYVAGKVPVVLVHGTASSPARWAELLNELQSDEKIRDHIQVWLFIYPTGNPVLYSASRLRESLVDTLKELDPEDRDPALRKMVLIGHSQGGLLVKAQVTSSGTRFWDNATDRPFEEVNLKPETREILSKAVFFEPLEFINRVIFISTPHRGSFLAGNWLGRIASNLATAPTQLLGTGLDLARAGISVAGRVVDRARDGIDRLQGDEGDPLERRFQKLPSSVDNMNPDHPFSRTFSSIPVDSRVSAHSIIPVTGGPPAEGQNDGVVEYTSAHIDEARTEFIVYNHGHSVQDHPAAIQEVRRILLEHLAAEIGPLRTR